MLNILYFNLPVYNLTFFVKEMICIKRIVDLDYFSSYEKK